VQEKLAWMITEIVKRPTVALHVGRLKDKGKADASHISMLKMNNVGIALETARKSRHPRRQRIVDDYCIMRHMNNLESVYTYEVPTTFTNSSSEKNHGHFRLCVSHEKQCQVFRRFAARVCRVHHNHFSQPQPPPAKPAATQSPTSAPITAFINLDRAQYQLQFAETAKFLGYAKTVLKTRGYTVETLRIVTQPFPEYTKVCQRRSHSFLQEPRRPRGSASRPPLHRLRLSRRNNATPRLISSPPSCKTRKTFSAASPSPTTGINWPAVNAPPA